MKSRSRELLALERARALSDFYWFSKFVIGWSDMQPHVHRDLCDTLQTIDTLHEDRAAEALVLMPRGSFKSSIGAISYSIWYLLNNPDARILIASATTDLARNTMTAIRSILENNKFFRELFGDKIARDARGKPVKLTLEDILFEGRSERGMQLREFSISCGAVGKIKNGAHYDLVILDDVVNHENCATLEQAAKVKRYYGQTHSQLEPHGAMVIIGTRYKYDDLYGYLLGNNEANQIIPDRCIVEKTDEESQVFFKEDFRYAKDVPEGCVRFLLIDPSMGGVSGDYTAMVGIAVDYEGNIFIEMSQQRKVRPSELIDWVYDMHRRYDYDRINIEQVGMSTLVDMIQEGYKHGRPFIPVVPIKASTQQSKETRIRQLEPYFKQHKIHFYGAHPQLEDQLLRFPGLVHDDLVDALSMMIRSTYEPTKNEPKKKKRRRFDVASKEIGREKKKSHFLKWRY
jgi:predicted phage terminase large subunit-like protein